jgi:hypothetical protein
VTVVAEINCQGQRFRTTTCQSILWHTFCDMCYSALRTGLLLCWLRHTLKGACSPSHALALTACDGVTCEAQAAQTS